MRVVALGAAGRWRLCANQCLALMGFEALVYSQLRPLFELTRTYIDCVASATVGPIEEVKATGLTSEDTVHQF